VNPICVYDGLFESVAGRKVKTLRTFGKYVFTLNLLFVIPAALPPAFAQWDATEKADAVASTPDGHPDFNGVWFPGVVPDPNHYGVTVTDHRLFDPKVTPQEPPSFQPWAIEKRKLMGDFDRISPALECRPSGALGFVLAPPYPIGIVQTPSQIAILSEKETTYRIIYTDGRPHLKNPDPQYNGDSVGHWEGDTLVVDVIGLDTKTWIPGAPGWFPSDALHLIERYRRAKTNNMVYQVTIEDPKVLTKPWTSVPRTFTFAPGKRLYEGYCIHNYDFEELNPGGKIPLTAEGNDERFFDEQEYQRLRKQYP
jgi:hypothetical protein